MEVEPQAILEAGGRRYPKQSLFSGCWRKEEQWVTRGISNKETQYDMKTQRDMEPVSKLNVSDRSTGDTIGLRKGRN